MNEMIDETLVPFTAGIRSLPGGPSISAGYRYALRGIKGVRLETILVGGRRYTSREALRRFVAGVTQAAAQCQAPSESPHIPQAADAALERRLDAQGL